MTTINRLTDQLTRVELSRRQRLQYGLIAFWVLAMISLPIMKWTLGADIIPTAVTFALLIQFSAVVVIMATGIGVRQTAVAFVLVAVATWGLEFIGSSTGFPFGAYNYTDVLQPQLGHVPLLIPVAWFMMLPSSWAIAQLLTPKHRLAAYIAVSAASITAWDLFLDPQMVAWNFWIWDDPVGYFGIPWVNYAGWFFTGIVVTLLVRPYRFSLPIFPLLIIYGTVWFLQTIGQAVFWGQPGPAIIGSIAMGTLLLLASRQYLKQIGESAGE